jgi:hypothetical protein
MAADFSASALLPLQTERKRQRPLGGFRKDKEKFKKKQLKKTRYP